MGDKDVSKEYNDAELRAFTLSVLNDLDAMEAMLAGDMFEKGVRRIGAEQEMFIVDRSMRPAPLAVEVIEAANDPRLTTEIGKFNLEANPPPLDISGSCLRELEAELNEILATVRRTAGQLDAGVVLAGILPTIQRSDLTLDNLTPAPRYYEIDRVVTALHGDDRVISIKGLDELQLKSQDTTTEFCNTSFQVHLQVDADSISNAYNWSQAIAAPILSGSVNSPLLLNNRLWNETRIALFHMSTDTRSEVHRIRRQTPRVHFGDRWADDSIVSILHDDAIRFRFLLTRSIEEDSLRELSEGRIPELSAWRLHNGTIWRWNRICYGILNGKPGLRIEARYLPAGPSIPDEMANAALFLGLMTELPVTYGDVRKHLPFDAVHQNFYAAARYGLHSQLTWIDGKEWAANELLLDELIPVAKRGLERAGIDHEDSDRLLGIFEDRVRSKRTGSKWMIESLELMDPLAKPNVRMRTITAAMKANQESGLPVHEWELASIPQSSEWIDNYKTVEQFMASDLYTVRPGDALGLAASLMDWRNVRHVPVENDDGELVGLMSHKDLIKLVAHGSFGGATTLVVRDVMTSDLITVRPKTSALEALQIMKDKKVGCLPVVEDRKLIGIVTAYDFLTVSCKLFEERLNAVMTQGTAAG